MLRYANYRDHDRILTLFTREQGILSAAARGCRRHRSPLLGCSEPFVYGEYMLFERGGRYTVDACDVREVFYPLREDVSRFAGGMAMLAVTEKSGTAEKSDALFSLLYHGLTFLAYGEAEPLDMTLCFTLRALRVLGLQPALTHCARCGADLRTQKRLRFAAAYGGAVCDACAAAAMEISPLSLEAMRRMLLLPDEEMQKVRLPQKARSEIRAALRAYTSWVLEYDFKVFDSI